VIFSIDARPGHTAARQVNVKFVTDDRGERSMSFGAIAADYDRLRPPPPPEAAEWLLPARRDVVVDLGAGTGLLARAVAPVAGHVIAVEPDDRMRSVLAERSPDVEVLAGRGEAIPLPDASADAVVISSAWHWMDPDRAVPEIARVLRDGGRFGVIWTGREQTPWLRPDEWFPVGDRDLAAPQGAERTTSERLLAVPYRGTFHKIETATFRFRRSMTIPDLVEWLTTYSRVITASDDVKAAGRAMATAALREQFPGATDIEVPMRSRGWRVDRLRRSGS
jgi:SAM-dependent methyltransferase